MRLLPILALLLLVAAAGCIESPPHLVPPTTAAALETPDHQVADAAGTLRVTVLDVGQGDAILVRTPNEKTMLVDAGDAGAGGTVVAGLRARNVTALDAAVVSHAHADHIGGFSTVLGALPVYTFYDAGYPATTKTYANLLSTVEAKAIRYVTPTAGQRIDLDPAVTIDVLSPDGAGRGDIHDNMLVLRLVYGDTSFLLTGDMAEDLEGEVALAPTDVLKVGHHGSATSSSAPFLAATRPSIAVVSVGTGNDYGHPTAEALARLANVGAAVYRTDRDGDVTVVSDGTRCAVAAG